MLRRQISAVMITVFIVFILINFIFSYSLFTFYKSAREEIDQGILRQERDEVIREVELEVTKENENGKENEDEEDDDGGDSGETASYQRSTTRLHFHQEQPPYFDNTVSEAAISQPDKNYSSPEQQQNDDAVVPETKQLPRRPKRPISAKNSTTTIEPKPDYYNSDEYYGDSNENLADKNYNHYDDGKFIVITPPGIPPPPEKSKNKLDYFLCFGFTKKHDRNFKGRKKGILRYTF